MRKRSSRLQLTMHVLTKTLYLRKSGILNSLGRMTRRRGRLNFLISPSAYDMLVTSRKSRSRQTEVRRSDTDDSPPFPHITLFTSRFGYVILLCSSGSRLHASFWGAMRGFAAPGKSNNGSRFPLLSARQRLEQELRTSSLALWFCYNGFILHAQGSQF